MAYTNFGWEQELPAVVGMNDTQAAAYINALTVPNTTPVYISFREFQNIQSSGSYSAMKQMFLNYTTGVEKPLSGWWVTDMFQYLEDPNQGYNVNAQPFFSALYAVYNYAGYLSTMGPAGNFPIASGFIASYVSGLAPPTLKYPQGAMPSQILAARGF